MGTRQAVVVGIVAAGLGVLVAQPLAGTAAMLPQPPAVPKLTVPAVTVPSVSTPVGTTPSVTTPSVTTPSVTTPSVTTPPVSTPVAVVPSVTTPRMTTPSVTTPPASAPSATAPARTMASKVSALVGGPTQSASPSGATGDPASAAPDLAGGAAGVPAAGGTRTGLARGGDGASRHESARARRIASARESRRLRRLVTGLHGCLGTLGVGAQRLLTLRAGLTGPARSAAVTARVLHVSPAREARLERLALVALQRSAATGCGGPSPVVARTLVSSGTLSPSAPPPSGAAPASGPTASLSAAHAERPGRGGRSLAAPQPRGTAVERAETTSSFPSVLVPALLALLLALALLALPETRRRLRPAAAPLGGAAPSGGDGPSGGDATAPRRESASIPPPPPPIAYSPTADPRTDAPRVPPMGPPRTGMEDAMSQMAADVFAEMARDTPTLAPQPHPEADPTYPHVQVERELLPHEFASPSRPAPRRAPVWAREHATQTALVATVAVGWLARLLRRGRRRRRRSG
ncbi:MAG TPA: hypothetical protein VIY10_01435 [Solirubrobacteraceae bacterium]